MVRIRMERIDRTPYPGDSVRGGNLGELTDSPRPAIDRVIRLESRSRSRTTAEPRSHRPPAALASSRPGGPATSRVICPSPENYPHPVETPHDALQILLTGECKGLAARSLGGTCGLLGHSCGRPERPRRDAHGALDVAGELALVREPGARGDLRQGQVGPCAREVPGPLDAAREDVRVRRQPRAASSRGGRSG
jgi:hypothetical protein